MDAIGGIGMVPGDPAALEASIGHVGEARGIAVTLDQGLQVWRAAYPAIGADIEDWQFAFEQAGTTDRMEWQS